MTDPVANRHIVARERKRPVSTPAQCPAEDEAIDTATSSSDIKSDYAIGYCRPPAHHRFQKGKSGNPNGRPKGSKNFDTIVLEAMQKRVKVRTPKGLKTVTSAEALMMKTVEAASKGNSRAIEKLFAWYAAALSTKAGSEPKTAVDEEPLSSGDIAILDAFRAIILSDSQDAEGGDVA